MKIGFVGSRHGGTDYQKELLIELKQKQEVTVISLNESIIPSEKLDSSLLKDGDQIEIFSFMGGG